MAEEDVGVLLARYVEARSAFIQADKDADALYRRIAAVAAGIGEPKNPTRRTERMFNAINANEWLETMPDREEVRRVMTDWAERRMAVRAARAAIPADKRDGLASLPPNAD